MKHWEYPWEDCINVLIKTIPPGVSGIGLPLSPPVLILQHGATSATCRASATKNRGNWESSINRAPTKSNAHRPVVKNSGSNWLEVTQKNVPCMWKVKNHIITNPWIVVFSETSKYTQLLTCKLPLQHKVWEIAQDFKTDLHSQSALATISYWPYSGGKWVLSG